MTAPADPVASTLTGIRERYDRAFTYEDWFQVGRDAGSLLTAIEAVLKADITEAIWDRWDRDLPDWDLEGSTANALAKRLAAEVAADVLREVITTALTGPP